ncbi:MAG: DegT/DnrJ/EryC1/StrS family aminotransferase [Opitutaceae bacterium]
MPRAERVGDRTDRTYESSAALIGRRRVRNLAIYVSLTAFLGQELIAALGGLEAGCLLGPWPGRRPCEQRPLVTFAPVLYGEDHAHEHAELCLLLEGKCRFSFEHQSAVLLAGDLVACPARTPHGEAYLKSGDGSGKLFGLGRKHVPEIGEAEEALSRYHAGRHVLATSSGHGALQAALAGLEICCGDEVITTPYTWGASTSCILHQNAIPVFVDVERETGLIDPAQVEAAITPRTRAILTAHLFGQPADLARLRAIADRHGLALIEDGSQAHGAEIDGRRAGTVGDAAGFFLHGRQGARDDRGRLHGYAGRARLLESRDDRPAHGPRDRRRPARGSEAEHRRVARA